MDVLEYDKKALKKWLARKRTKRDLMIQKHLKVIHEEEERIEEMRKQMEPKRTETRKDDKEQLWSAKTQEIRNRLTDKKRNSAERWNRFAGTSDSGGRGL